MWGANAANLVLNLALVPAFGAVGSAWSTVGARFCLACGVVAWVWALRDGARFGVREPAVGPSYKSLLGVGSAAALSHAAESGAFSGMTLLAGRLGATAVSGYQILLNLLSIVFMISLGVSSATAVLTSEATGRRAPTDASRASFGGLALNTLCMLVAAVFVLSFAGSIGRAYTANLTLAAFVSSVLWLAAVVMLPDGGQVVVAAALRARGDNWFPTVSHLLAYALVMPALAYWLAEARGQGVMGLMLAIFGASMLSCGVLCLRLWHLHRQAIRLPIG
jgi:MATE family multidrug resistance protein